MKNIIKLGFVLSLFAVISCVLLALVNNKTKPVIEKREAAKEQEALNLVLPSAKAYLPVDKETADKIISSVKKDTGSAKFNQLFKAVDNDNNVIGYAANITGPTFETTTILLGIDLNKTITGVSILKTTDTPGKQKMADYKTSKASSNKGFTEQFTGVAPLNSFEDGKDYETISGATLSSGGVSSMVKSGTIVLSELAELNK